jgi:hypothetical protein
MMAEHAHVFVVDKRWDWKEQPQFVEVSLLSGSGPLSKTVQMSDKDFRKKLCECEGRAVVVIDRDGVGHLDEDNKFGDGKSPVWEANDEKYKGGYRQMLVPKAGYSSEPIVAVGIITEGDIDDYRMRFVSPKGFRLGFVKSN